MTEFDKIDQEPEVTSAKATMESPKSRRAFSKVRRELTEEEIANPAVHRMILDDLDRLESEVSDLSSYKDRFHQADKERAVLAEKASKSAAVQILYEVAIAIGALFIGLSTSVWSNKPFAIVSALAGVVLILGAVNARSKK